MEAYKPKQEDEIGFSVGCLVKVIQKNVDGWWFIRFEEEEGWGPAMFLREVYTSSVQRHQPSIRRIQRSTLRSSISDVVGK